MLLYAFLLFVLLSVTSVMMESLPKCCGFNEEIFFNETYSCREDMNMRWQIISDNTNFFERNVNGTCKETYEEDIYEFVVTEGEIKKGKVIEESDYYSKCCPWNYTYDPVKHNCIKISTEEENRFQETFRIGLPHCKIIDDYVHNDGKPPFRTVNDSGIVLDDTQELISKKNYCRDKINEDSYVLRVCKDSSKICDRKRCIRKCCPDGQSFINGKFCKNTHVRGVDLKVLGNVQNPEDNYAIIHGYEGILTLLPHNDSSHTLLVNGSFLEDTKEGRYMFSVNEEEYCIEHAIKKTDLYSINNHMMFLVQSSRKRDKPIPLKIIINRYVLSISCFFLLLTILFYIISKELRKLFGKILVSLCLALLATFLLLIYFGFDEIPHKNVCRTFGFLLLYLGYSCFTWLNVMCFDIYWTFGSPKTMTGFQKQAEEKKRFIYYSLYGWGVPCLLLIITFIFYYVDVLPEVLRIYIGDRKCLIENRTGNFAEILFSIIPISIIELVNIFLFVKTIIYCLKVKNEIRKMNDTNAVNGDKKKKFNANTERFGLIIKLFIIMGTSFLFEVVSSFYNFSKNDVTKYIEITWDILNCLQGVFIFFIFACKKKILIKCKTNIGIKKLRRTSMSSGLTQSTNIGSNRRNSIRKS